MTHAARPCGPSRGKRLSRRSASVANRSVRSPAMHRTDCSVTPTGGHARPRDHWAGSCAVFPRRLTRLARTEESTGFTAGDFGSTLLGQMANRWDPRSGGGAHGVDGIGPGLGCAGQGLGVSGRALCAAGQRRAVRPGWRGPGDAAAGHRLRFWIRGGRRGRPRGRGGRAGCLRGADRDRPGAYTRRGLPGRRHVRAALRR